MRNFVEIGARYQEIPAHRIGYVCPTDHAAEACSKLAYLATMRRKVTDATTVHLPTGNDEVQIFSLHTVQHPWEDGLVVLKIRVHNGKVRRTCRKHSFNS